MKGGFLKLLSSSTVRIVKGAPKFLRHNSNWLLATLALLGVTGLTWSTIRGTIKAVKLCEEKQIQGKKEILKTTWRLYIPAVGFFILTTISIACNARINARRLATMTGLVAMSQADLKQLRDKVAETVGPKKEKAIEAEVEKDKVRALPPMSEKDIIKTGHGNDLFIDWLTGQRIRTSLEWVEATQEKINNTIKDDVTNTLDRRFYHERLHIPHCGADELFWDLAEMRQNGYSEITLDCTHTDWVEVDGRLEMACTIRCVPEATGF